MHHGTISKPIADWSKAGAAVQECAVCGFADGLLELRRRIEKGDAPSSKLDETLNLATWNLRW